MNKVLIASDSTSDLSVELIRSHNIHILPLECVINLLEPLYIVAVLLVVTAYFVDGSFSPFLYFRF